MSAMQEEALGHWYWLRMRRDTFSAYLVAPDGRVRGGIRRSGLLGMVPCVVAEDATGIDPITDTAAGISDAFAQYDLAMLVVQAAATGVWSNALFPAREEA